MPIDVSRPIEEPEKSLFDEDKWREVIKARRKELKIPNAAKFVEILWLKTRVKMQKNTYYKIEQGGQKTSLLQFFSINIVLFDDIVPPKNVMSTLLAPEWVEVINRCYSAKKAGASKAIVPFVWGINNFHTVYDEDKLPVEFRGCEGFEQKFLISRVENIDHRLLYYPGEEEAPYPDEYNCVYKEQPM